MDRFVIRARANAYMDAEGGRGKSVDRGPRWVVNATGTGFAIERVSERVREGEDYRHVLAHRPPGLAGSTGGTGI